MGSTGAVSEAVETEVKAINKAIEIQRIGGKNRFETAQLIAKKLNSDNGKAVVATGFKFPDALSVAPYAAQNEIPILLTKSTSTSEYTEQALQGKSTTYVIGGEGAVTEGVAESLPGDVQRVAGTNRFETASKIIQTFDLGDQQGVVATGYKFADALTGSVLAAKKNAPLLIVRENTVTAPTADLIQQRKIHNFILLGGPGVVNVDDELAGLAEDTIE